MNSELIAQMPNILINILLFMVVTPIVGGFALSILWDVKFTKSLVYSWFAIVIFVLLLLFGTNLYINYNSISNKVIRNIENNPKNWTYHMDSTLYKEAFKSDPKSYWLSKFQTMSPYCLENKNCGIQINFYEYGQCEMIKPISYIFSKEEGDLIFYSYEKPIKEHFKRLMEPVNLINKWKEEAKNDSTQKQLQKTLDDCK